MTSGQLGPKVEPNMKPTKNLPYGK